MRSNLHPIDACRALFAICAFVIAGPASAQTHEVSRHGYTLRSSTVASTTLDARTARAHGIEPGPGRGVLNVIVLRSGRAEQQGVPSDVHAEIRNLAGIRREVHMNAVRQNGYVSYVGAYDYAPREVLDFRIEARPRDAKRALVLSYRDRMWRGDSAK